MEPAARTGASGKWWPTRAGALGGAHGQPLNTNGAAAVVQASKAPQQRGGIVPVCHRGHRRGGDTAGLWARHTVSIPEWRERLELVRFRIQFGNLG